MALLEIVKTRHVTASIRLEEATAGQIDQYAAFVHSSADEVVDKALAYVFGKDRDFQEFLRTPEAAQVAGSLRIRAVPQPSTAPVPTNGTAKPAKAVEAASDSRPRS
jgi:hypothetical protein